MVINLNIDSNKYKDLCVILHNISSWPNDWILFIESNKEMFNNYYKEEKRINLVRNKNDNFNPFTKNKYQNSFNKTFLYILQMYYGLKFNYSIIS